jgi:uncharacterized protein (TIGR00251 family)
VRIPLTPVKAGIALAVRVVPRGGRTTVAGVRGDALLVRLAAAPVDGAANDELIAFFAEIFGRPRRDVTLLSGHQSRNKRVAIGGLTEAQVALRLDVILSE